MDNERKIATKGDWEIEEMPKETESFILEHAITAKEMNVLRIGNIPKEMEDKWFWYMEDNTLYAHRSWTGYCIFKIEFKEDDKHLVTVNRNIDQYSCKDIEEDKKILNSLLDWWTSSPYDYYGEWLDETATAINSAKKK